MSASDKSFGWDEFRSLIEERFAKARKMDPQDVPFPLCGHEASVWLRCKRETLQWVSEIMPEQQGS